MLAEERPPGRQSVPLLALSCSSSCDKLAACCGGAMDDVGALLQSREISLWVESIDRESGA